MTVARFVDRGWHVNDFMGEILVVCPKCNGCARTFRVDRASKDPFAPRRLVCACGYTHAWASRQFTRNGGAPYDDYFGLPLWLQVRCSDGALWAYNREHLAMLQAFVQAKLRERRRDPALGWLNKSFLGRLPAWIKSAKNRDAILRRLHRLQAKLPIEDRAATSNLAARVRALEPT